MFYICAHLTLGTATGKAGMSSAICIGVSMILPGIFAVIGSENVYNPFTLNMLAGSVVFDDTRSAVPAQDILMTVFIAFAVMAVLYFIALFAQNAKKIDNSGNEIRI
jgi:hypothetical protein